MSIEIRDTSLEARILRQAATTESGSAEEALSRLLDTQEEQDRWLAESRADHDAKIKRGLEQLDRGEGVSEDKLAAWLALRKAGQEARFS
jgi:predicted transcriptional regulator